MADGGRGAEEKIEDRDVVTREIVDRPHIAPDRAEVGARGVHVVDASEFTAVEVDLQVLHTGIVEENVADHEHTALGRGEIAERAAFGDGGGERLFAEHVFAGLERLPDEGEMALHRRGDDDGVNVRRKGDGRGVDGRVEVAKLFACESEPAGGGVADTHDVTIVDHAEVAHVVGAPLSEADHTHAHS